MKINFSRLILGRSMWKALLHRCAVLLRELRGFLRPALATAALAGSPAQADEIYIFGDSGADMGNYHALPGFAPSTRAPYFKGADGLTRLSDGPMWPELLWPGMPSWAAAQSGQEITRMNFAYGGARSDEGSFIGAGIDSLPIGMLSQISAFEAGAADGSIAISPGTRAVLYAGTNDLFEAATTGSDVNATITAVGHNLATAAERLATAGVKTIYVSEIADIGEAAAFYHTGLPAEEERDLRAALNAIGQAARREVRDALVALNQRLAGSARVVLLPANDLFTAVRKDPEGFGFTDMTGRIYDEETDRILETDAAKRAGYFFVDGLHTTARAQFLEARYYRAVMDAAEGAAQRRAARIVDGARAAVESISHTLTDQTSREQIASRPGAGWSFFVASPFTRQRLSSTATEDAASTDTSAITIGAQWPGTREPGLTLAFSLVDQDGRVGGRRLRFDQQGIDLSVANAKDWGLVRIGAVVGYSVLDVETRRDVGIAPPAARPRAGTDGAVAHSRVFAGHDLSLGRWNLNAEAALVYEHATYDAFREKGLSGITIAYDEIDHESFQGQAGLVVRLPEYELWGGRLVPSLALRGQYEMADDTIDVRGTLQGNILGAEPGRASLGGRLHGEIEPRLDYLRNDRLRVSLSYRYETGGRDFERHGVALSVAQRF